MMNLFASIEFAHSFWLWLLPASLAITFAVLWFRSELISNSIEPLQNLSSQAWRHTAIAWLQQFDARQQDKLHSFVFVKRSLSYAIFLSLIHLALAQPYQQGQRLPDPPQHRDIVFVIDTSVSMVLEDYIVNGQRTSRMAMLQGVMQHFIERLKGNRIGLVVYAEQAYTLAPLTTDYALLKTQFNRIVPAVLTGRTSNPGKALLYTLNTYKNDTTEDKPTIVLISDVNRPDREIDPRVAAASLQQHGFRVHSIAIGAGSYAAENKQGTHLVYHPTNYPLLEQIAKSGHGKFFSVNNIQNIKHALSTIQQTELRKIEVEPQHIKIMLYHWPLLLAVLFMSLVQLVQLIRPTK